MQDHMDHTLVRDVADLRQRLTDARCKALWTLLLMNGVRNFTPLWMRKKSEHLL